MACHDKYWCHKFKTHKKLWCHKKSWIAMKIWDTLLPNGMPYHHHMEDQVIINRQKQQYFQINDMNHDVKLMSQVMRCCDYKSTLLPCGMPCQHHTTISYYYSPKVAKMNGILILTNFG
jgi:hypothetical protein